MTSITQVTEALKKDNKTIKKDAAGSKSASSVDLKQQARFISNINTVSKENKKLLNAVSRSLVKINEKLNKLNSSSRSIKRRLENQVPVYNVVLAQEKGKEIIEKLDIKNEKLAEDVAEIKNYARDIAKLLMVNNDPLQQEEEKEDNLEMMKKFFDDHKRHLEKEKEDKHHREKDVSGGFMTDVLGISKPAIITALLLAGSSTSGFFDKSGGGQLLKAGTALAQPGGIEKTTGFLTKTVKSVRNFFSPAVIEEGAEEATKLAEKGLMKRGIKFGGKILGKKIPIVGAGIAAKFAADRAREGDYWGASLELASGILSIVPGFGTAASIVLDAALVAKDIASNSNTVSQNLKIATKNSQIAMELASDALKDAKGNKLDPFFQYSSAKQASDEQSKAYTEASKNYEKHKSSYDATLLSKLENTFNQAHSSAEVQSIYDSLLQSEKTIAENSGLLKKFQTFKSLGQTQENILTMESDNPELQDRYSREIKSRNAEINQKENIKLLDEAKRTLSEYIRFFSKYKIDTKQETTVGLGGSSTETKTSLIDLESGKEINDESLLNQGLSLQKQKAYTLQDKKTEMLLEKHNPDLLKLVELVSNQTHETRLDYMETQKKLSDVLRPMREYSADTINFRNTNKELPAQINKINTSEAIKQTSLQTSPTAKPIGNNIIQNNINNSVTSPTLLSPKSIAEEKPWWMFSGNKVSFN